MKKLLLFLVCFVSIVIGLASCSEPNVPNGQNNSSDEITIYGNVIDRATGQPLYNVLIQEKNKVGGSTVTGSDGNYEFTLPLNGRSNGVFTIVASKSLYSDAEYELYLNNVDGGRNIRVDFQLETGVYYIEGKVTDTNGSPLSYVLIKETYHNVGNSVYSDNNGNYKMELYPYSENSNKYVLTASATDYYSEEYTLNFTPKDFGRTSTVNFQLTSSIKPVIYCYMKGTVITTVGSRWPNKPVGYVLIECFKHTDKNTIGSNLIVSGYTDSQGNCKLKVPIDNDFPYYTFQASKSHWAIWEREEGNTIYSRKTLQINENMENQTFYINWKAYERDSYATLN